jgi:hypothetical protein
MVGYVYNGNRLLMIVVNKARRLNTFVGASRQMAFIDDLVGGKK